MSNDNVQVDITVDSVGVTRQGFGLPLLVSHSAVFPVADLVVLYTSTAEAGLDWATTSPEYRWVRAMFSQSPKPPRVAIGHAPNSGVTQQYTLDVVSVKNSTAYVLTVEGEDFNSADLTYTSDASASQGEIHNGLVTLLNAVADKNYTASFAPLVFADATFTADNATEIFTIAAHGLQTGDGPFRVSNSGGALPTGLLTATDYWVIRIDANTFYLATSLVNALSGTHLSISTNGTGTQTMSDTVSTVSPDAPFLINGDAVGNYFSVKVAKLSLIKIAQTHDVSLSLSDDLDALVLANSDWYQLHTSFNSKAYVVAAATWAESALRTYVFDTCDSEVVTLAYSQGVTTDIGSTLLELGFTYTMGCYHPRPAVMFAGAWMGRWLPTDPGQATAKFKTLSGVETVVLTPTQKNNLKSRRMNTYGTDFGRAITFEGTVFSTVYRFIDVRRDVDWLSNTVQIAVFGILAGSDKVPYTDAGIARVEGAVRGAVEGTAVQQDVLAEGTTAIEVPAIGDISATDKEDRILRNIKFFGTLTGAIHAVIPISGTVTF